MMDLIDLPQSVAEPFGLLLYTSVVSSVVALAALAIHHALVGRVSNRWLYLLWMLVLFRFALAATPESYFSFENLQGIELEGQGETASFAFQITESFEPISTSTFETTSVVEKASETSDLLVESVEPFAASKLNLQQWIMPAVWFAGLLFFLLRLLRSYSAVRRIVKNSVVAKPALQQQFTFLQKQLRRKVTAKLRVTEEVQSPAMFGVFHPTILLPRWCEEDLSQKELEHVFVHELVHARRLDGLWQLVSQLIAAIHWFNPMVWMAIRFADSSRELACDETAVQLLRTDAVHSSRTSAAYGRTIVRISESLKQSSTSKPAPTWLMGRFAGIHQKLIKQRIAMLVNNTKRNFFATMSLACWMLLLFACGFTSAQSGGVATTSNPEKEPSHICTTDTD